ncbi:nitroreductase family deazaflavin-dependent oxidoreductase [Micromonospora sp. CA-269861]|uniref:nitroreductase family deazaflavin-dependent oxidoreductase n=1 Tax=Micromonospora sp. CA-269861 TaxID=3239968 RepID=UPI003D8CB310
MADEEIHDSPTKWVADHVRSYVETAGAKGHDFQGKLPTLLLTTRGRRTGKLRRTALIYGRDGDRYVVVASAGGQEANPAWYLNLCAEPEVSVQVYGETFQAKATVAAEAERPALWEKMAGIFSTYRRYQKKASREIPVVLLEPLR